MSVFLLALSLTGTVFGTDSWAATASKEDAKTKEKSPRPSSKGIRRYAVVIGVNLPANSSQATLRFADDDAVRFYELFRAVGNRAVLFSVLDEETQKLSPQTVKIAKTPSKARVLKEIESMFSRMVRDNKDGFETEFYFVYSGHGYADDYNEGHLMFVDGTMSRSDFYDDILTKSTASVNHIIIDACDAYLFVQSRGDEMEEVLNKNANKFIDAQTLNRFPNTGAILSTAAVAQTHEWSEIGAGVFSHGVRSALLGAADADGDAKVSYQELDAFVVSVTSAVTHARANRAIFVSPPKKDRRRAVIDLSDVRTQKLYLSKDVAGRISVADQSGRRYADVNKGKGYANAMLLLPGNEYFVKWRSLEFSVPRKSSEIDLASLYGRPSKIGDRGSGIGKAYSLGLFAVPYGPELLEGFELGLHAQQLRNLGYHTHASTGVLRTLGWVTAGAAVVAGGLAAGSFIKSSSIEGDRSSVVSDNVRVQQLNQRIQTWDTRGNVALATAISLGSTAGLLFLLHALGL